MQSQHYKEKAPPGRNAPQGEIYHRHMEERLLNPNRPRVLGYSAGSSGLIHITCRSLFEASTAPLCMDGSATSPSVSTPRANTQTDPVM